MPTTTPEMSAETDFQQFEPTLPPDLNPWEWWRGQMPIAQNWAYFDHAAVAPLPEPTTETMIAYARQASTQGDTVWLSWAARLEKLRAGIAQWINAAPEEIALIPNTTYGINTIAEGIRWQEGDNIVIPGGEFPSNHFPWQNQARRGVELRIVPSPAGRVDLDGIRRAIDGRTRLVAASWVGYSSGFRLPLDDLCQLAHERGTLVFLDAIQGLGPFPLDLAQTPVDFLAADGHKWMLGPEGAGLMFIRRPHLERLDCVPVGWNSIVGSSSFSSHSMDLRPSAARYEGGSQNMAGLLSMHASLQMFWQVVAQHGPQAIPNRILELHAHAREGLRSRGVRLISDWHRQNRSGILTFVPRTGTPEELRTKLAKSGIAVSCRGGGVRLSIHVYNTPEEIDALLEHLP